VDEECQWHDVQGIYTCWVGWIGGGSQKWQPIGSGPCEVGVDRQTVRGGEGVYNSGAKGITVSCWMVVSSL